jgi:hypothetical protein
MKEMLLLNLLPVLLEEGQFLEEVLELDVEFEDACLAYELLEETHNIEALLVEDEVNQGNAI